MNGTVVDHYIGVIENVPTDMSINYVFPILLYVRLNTALDGTITEAVLPIT